MKVLKKLFRILDTLSSSREHERNTFTMTNWMKDFIWPGTDWASKLTIVLGSSIALGSASKILPEIAFTKKKLDNHEYTLFGQQGGS